MTITSCLLQRWFARSIPLADFGNSLAIFDFLHEHVSDGGALGAQLGHVSRLSHHVAHGIRVS